MSDGQFLLLVAVLLYLWECGLAARDDALVMLFRPLRGWAVRLGPSVISIGRWSARLAQPLPGLPGAMTCATWPVLLSLEGFYPWPAWGGQLPASHGMRWHAWNSLGRLTTHGRQVRSGPDTLLTCCCHAQARWCAALLSRVAECPAADRASVIANAVRESFAWKAAAWRYRRYVVRTRPLTVATGLLFVHSFVVTPLVAWRLGLSTTWAPLLIGIIVLTAAVSVLAYRVHRYFDPEGTELRWTMTINLVLYPLAALRAVDKLSRELLVGYEPLAVARALCKPREFEAFAGKVLPLMAFPPPETDQRVEAAARFTHGQMLESALELVRQAGLDPDRLLAPPPRDDPSCGAYCPRCHCQYRAAEGSCHLCGGVQLHRFVSEPQPAT